MNNNCFLPALSSLFNQWHRDRSIQRRMPLHRQWRGCMGLALLVDQFDQNAVAVGDRVFLPNHALTWMVLRDIPPENCSHFLDPHHVGGSLVTCTRTTIVHGMPRIHFASQAGATWNLRYVPRFGTNAVPVPPHVLDARGHHREFAIVTQMSTNMTFWRTGPGNPFPHRGAVMTPHQPCDLWMPRPYLVCKGANTHALPRMRSPIQGGQPWQCQLPDSTVGIYSFLAARLPHRQKATDMWWEVTHCEQHLQTKLDAFVFPPLAMHTWTHLRRPLPGDVELDASVAGVNLRRTYPRENGTRISVTSHITRGNRLAMSR